MRLSDLRGIQRLGIEAALGVADLVEAVHHTILRLPGPLGAPPEGRTRGITGLVYRSVRGITRLVGGSAEALLARLADAVGEPPSSQDREALLAAVNGIIGDHLAASANPLAIPMRLRIGGTPLEMSKAELAARLPRAGPHVVVLVHGLCMNDLQWTRQAHDHGAALARDVGCTPLYLSYNSGRHVSQNGRDFAELMEALLGAWPGRVEQVSIVGHSMGGLVARSACHHAARAGQAWLQRLERLVFLGTPHLGAPLERAGVRADYLIGISPYSTPFARLGKIRSAGIRDLAHGFLCDEDWQMASVKSAVGRHAVVPLPSGVRCYAMAASLQAHPGPAGARTRGDGLVPIASALGRSPIPSRDLGLPRERCWIGYAMGHFDLLDRPEAYERIRSWMADAPSAAR